MLVVRGFAVSFCKLVSNDNKRSTAFFPHALGFYGVTYAEFFFEHNGRVFKLTYLFVIPAFNAILLALENTLILSLGGIAVVKIVKINSVFKIVKLFHITPLNVFKKYTTIKLKLQ